MARHAERLKKDLIQVLGLPDSDVKLERLADRSWRVTYQTAQTRTVRAATLDEANQAQPTGRGTRCTPSPSGGFVHSADPPAS